MKGQGKQTNSRAELSARRVFSQFQMKFNLNKQFCFIQIRICYEMLWILWSKIKTKWLEKQKRMDNDHDLVNKPIIYMNRHRMLPYSILKRTQEAGYVFHRK